MSVKHTFWCFCDSCALHSSQDIWKVNSWRPTSSDSGSVCNFVSRLIYAISTRSEDLRISEFTGTIITRQIWGIWKLRPAYSPETPNLGQNRWCFVLCHLEIWWMTLKNNRAPLQCYFQLCASFPSHWCIQTWVRVRKRPIWVKFDDF